MTSHDVKDSEQRLQRFNAKRLGEAEGEPLFDVYVPYSYFSSAKPGKDEAKYQIGKSLAHFLFIKAPEADLKWYVNESSDNDIFNRIKFYYDRRHCIIPVSENEIHTLMEACKEKGDYEIHPTIDTLKGRPSVILNTTALKGCEAKVVDVIHKPGGDVSVSAEVQMFNRTVSFVVKGLTSEDFVIKGSDVKAIEKDDHLIDTTQTKLLDILGRVANNMHDEETFSKDQTTLASLYASSYHHFENRSAEYHFRALMLICAYLSNDRDGCGALKAEVEAASAELVDMPDSKIPKHTQAYLWVSLFIVTKKTRYRDYLKEYIKEHDIPSGPLKTFFNLAKRHSIKPLVTNTIGKPLHIIRNTNFKKVSTPRLGSYGLIALTHRQTYLARAIFCELSSRYDASPDPAQRVRILEAMYRVACKGTVFHEDEIKKECDSRFDQLSALTAIPENIQTSRTFPERDDIKDEFYANSGDIWGDSAPCMETIERYFFQLSIVEPYETNSEASNVLYLEFFSNVEALLNSPQIKTDSDEWWHLQEFVAIRDFLSSTSGERR